MNKENAKAFVLGFEAGEAAEQDRIIKWIEANRRKFELDDNVFIYRDSFNSNDLIAFIRGGKNG